LVQANDGTETKLGSIVNSLPKVPQPTLHFGPAVSATESQPTSQAPTNQAQTNPTGGTAMGGNTTGDTATGSDG
jgi:hypothetical protein